MKEVITITLTKSDALELLSMLEYPKELEITFKDSIERLRKEIKDRLIYNETSFKCPKCGLEGFGEAVPHLCK